MNITWFYKASTKLALPLLLILAYAAKTLAASDVSQVESEQSFNNETLSALNDRVGQPLEDIVSDNSSLKPNNVFFWLLLAGGLGLIFQCKRLIAINSKNNFLQQQLEQAKKTLAEFKKQNNEVLRGLEHSSDPFYIPADDTPSEFICPISQEIIREPVIIQDGLPRAYERAFIERWWNHGHRQTPCSRAEMSINPRVLPNNLALREKIANYIISRRENLAEAETRPEYNLRPRS